MTPRALIASAVLGASLAGAAAATGPVPLVDLPGPQVAALSGIDVPISGERGRALLESAFGAQPLSELIAIARDSALDPGVRLRAYRGVGLYQAPLARTALSEDLAGLASAQPGTDVLYLRAVIEALGEQREPDDVAILVPFLDFDVRDVRVATADALRRIGSTTALPALNARNLIETSPQVQEALQDAIRTLVGG